MVLFLFTGIVAVAQEPFQKLFGDTTADERLIAIKQRFDGHIFAFGITNETSNGRKIITMFEFDSAGNEVNYHIIGGKTDNSLNAVLYYEQEEFFIIAYEGIGTNNDLNSYLMKVDEAGNEIWEVEYGQTDRNESFLSLRKDVGGTILVTGFVTGAGFGNDYLLARYNSEGQQIWEHTHGDTLNQVAWSAIPLGDKIYVFGDNQESLNGQYGVAYLVYTSNGQFLEQDTLDWPYNSGCRKACYGSDSSIYVIGESSSDSSDYFDPYLIKFNKQGQLQWQKLLSETKEATVGFDIIEIQENRFLITGYGHGASSGNSDMHATLIDSGGNIIQRKYYDSGGLVDIGYNISPSIYGGYFVVGNGVEGLSNQYFLVYDQMPGLTNSVIEEELHTIEVFPNPATDWLYLRSETIIHKIDIMDAKGKVILSQNPETTFTNLELTVPLGIYWIKLFTKHGITTRKILIK